MHLETYRGTAVTGKLSFKISTSEHVYAVNGSTACTDKFEGLTTTDNFTFTASVQGTGLYTYAGIRIWCGEDYVNFFSHTASTETVIIFDGWNRPTVKTSIALQNTDKATYKVVKTDSNMSFYLNDTLIFEMGPNYSLNANWGEKFFKDGAVYTFGQYVEPYKDGGGSGYYTEINLETVKNVKIAIQGDTACADKFEGYKAANNFTFTATVQGTGLYTHAGIRIWCGDNFIDFYSHTYGGNATFVKFGNIDENGGNAFNVAPVLTSVNIANAEKGVYKVVKTSEKLSLYVNDTLIFEFDKDFNLAKDWDARFFEDGAVYTFGQYVEAGPGGTGYYCDLGLEY